MRISLKSIYIKVLISFLLVIISNLIISTVIEYYTYTKQLPRLITEIRTKSIAGNLSSAYTRDKNWNNIDTEVLRINNIENLNTLEDANLRIIIRDSGGKTIYNSFLEITRLGNSELIEGESQEIIDYQTGETVGLVTIYISQTYIRKHSQTYIRSLLSSGIYKGLLTAAIALLLSLLLSRKITKPIIQLTRAAQSIADNKDGRLIYLNSSDEINRLSSTFNSMIKSLQTQKKLRSQLLSNISHEINTPLNTIRLEARGLSDGLVSTGEACRNIIGEVDALKNIVYDLDWLAETDSGAYILNKEEYNLQKLISDETGRWLHKAETRNMKLVIQEFPEALPSVRIDVIRMNTVLGNLISNALKYSPGGSRITISCRPREEMIEVSVCDEGPPIAAEHQSSIFDRFYRVNSDQTSTETGRGLGLSIVKQIIELHEGRLRLESGDEKGNCFIFSLPAKN